MSSEVKLNDFPRGSRNSPIRMGECYRATITKGDAFGYVLGPSDQWHALVDLGVEPTTLTFVDIHGRPVFQVVTSHHPEEVEVMAEYIYDQTHSEAIARKVLQGDHPYTFAIAHSKTTSSILLHDAETHTRALDLHLSRIQALTVPGTPFHLTTTAVVELAGEGEVMTPEHVSTMFEQLTLSLVELTCIRAVMKHKERSVEGQEILTMLMGDPDAERVLREILGNIQTVDLSTLARHVRYQVEAAVNEVLKEIAPTDDLYLDFIHPYRANPYETTDEKDGMWSVLYRSTLPSGLGYKMKDAMRWDKAWIDRLHQALTTQMRKLIQYSESQGLMTRQEIIAHFNNATHDVLGVMKIVQKGDEISHIQLEDFIAQYLLFLILLGDRME